MKGGARMYFTRTEESIKDVQLALERGRSVRRWATFGEKPYMHLIHADLEERDEILSELGLDPMSDGDFSEWVWSHDFTTEEDEIIINYFNLEPAGLGYAQYLGGLCALEEFETLPDPEECTATLYGGLFSILACYEGEPVGIDPDEGWTLFRPMRIAWAVETGSNDCRVK